jgi:choline-sulfatase
MTTPGVRPNIILILTDHLRRDYVDQRTMPNVMALAARGTTFANAYSAAPLCQPARNCIITGMHPTAHGVCGNQSPPLCDDLRHDTFMRRLQAAGYHTALVGKHHYIDRYGIGMDVTADDEVLRDYGFDEVFQVQDEGENMHNDDRYTQYLAAQGRLSAFRDAQREGGWRCDPHPFEADETTDGFIGCNGIDFVERYDREQPFYLNLSFIGPHPPFWHPGEQEPQPDREPAPIGEVDSEATRTRRWHYRQKCTLIDHYVGRLAAALEARGQLDNTVIIFTSDHGDMLGDFGIWDKRYFYEASVGVPLVIAGGPMAAATRQNGARVSKSLVSHLDLYPTLLALAGAEPADDRRRPGQDLVSMVVENRPGHREVIAELATAMMIRNARWKLVFDPEQGGVRQLFNLVRDPQELDNLAGVAGYEAVTAELASALLADKILRTQFTHVKEEQRLQHVRAAR